MSVATETTSSSLVYTYLPPSCMIVMTGDWILERITTSVKPQALHSKFFQKTDCGVICLENRAENESSEFCL